jgi:hypothetical protein
MGLVKLDPLLRNPPLRSLVVQDGHMTLLSLLADVAQIFGMPSDIDIVRKAVHFLGYGDDEAVTLSEFVRKRSQRDPNMQGFGGVSGLEEDLLTFIAPQYDVIRSGRGLQSIEWPPYSLLRPEYPDRLTLGPANLTGPARFLHYGPYLALPRGVWRAEMSVEVKDCLSDNIIGVDASSERVLALVTAKLPARGVFDFELEFEVQDPSKPVEIRVRLMTGAIEGELLLRRIQLTRPEAVSAQDEERWARPLWRTA